MKRDSGEMLDEALVASLAEATGLGRPSLVLERLASAGDVLWSLELDALRPTYPASMIKLPIAMVLAALCEARAYGADDVVAVTDANMTPNDAPSPFVPGYQASLRELASAMLAASDNVATNVLIDVVGRDTVTRACTALGLSATAVHRKLSGAWPLIDDPGATGRNTHPARDNASLLRLLARDGEYPSRWVYDALAAQMWNGKLSAGLQRGDRFAHKTGDTDDVSHDGGILTLASGERYILVAYTTLPATPETDARFAAFMRALRPHLVQRTVA